MIPNSEIEWGARPPRAQFSAPSRKTVERTKKFQTHDVLNAFQSAGREARSATPGAGVLPELRSNGLNFIGNTGRIRASSRWLLHYY